MSETPTQIWAEAVMTAAAFAAAIWTPQEQRWIWFLVILLLIFINTRWKLKRIAESSAHARIVGERLSELVWEGHGIVKELRESTDAMSADDASQLVNKWLAGTVQFLEKECGKGAATYFSSQPSVMAVHHVGMKSVSTRELKSTFMSKMDGFITRLSEISALFQNVK